jgi:hypothetical protein
MDTIKEARKLVLADMEKYGTPRKIWFDLSFENGIRLMKQFIIDEKIVTLGTILMDFKLGLARSEGRLNEHVKMSSDATKEFLATTDLSEEEKNKIINCVEAHHGEIPFTCKEAEICANADSYKFLTIDGFTELLFFLGKLDMTSSERLDFVEKKIDEKFKMLSLDICKQELTENYHRLKKFIQDSR